MMVELPAGQRHESVVALDVLARGLDRLWFDVVAGDRGRSSHEIRGWLAEWKIDAVILRHRDERDSDDYDAARYREQPGRAHDQSPEALSADRHPV